MHDNELALFIKLIQLYLDMNPKTLSKLVKRLTKNYMQDQMQWLFENYADLMNAKTLKRLQKNVYDDKLKQLIKRKTRESFRIN